MSALVKQLRLLQAWYLPAGPEPEEAMPSKYRAFKEAADRIVELERDLAARDAELAACRAELGKFSERNVYALRDRIAAAEQRAEAAERELAAMKAENSKLRSALEIVHFKREPWQ